jgi:hypothetical protein
MMTKFGLWTAVLTAWLAVSGAVGSAVAQTAPTPNTNGPFAVTSVEYRFAARTDSLVTNQLPTEIWAVLWRPKSLGKGRHPVVFLVHGNHATCGTPIPNTRWRNDDRSDYTTTGRCPPGYVVVPNHRGYDYIGRRLASWGMIAISVNLNRGITVAPNDPGDPGLILRRARMVLRHLTVLAGWDNGSVAPPKGLGFNPRRVFDFSRIGLMGHSRGGDAIVAVPKVFASGSTWKSRLPSNTRFRVLMALAPTDFQAARPAPGNAVFSTLIPTCDGDVVDMQGIRFFDRALKLGKERAKRLEKSSFQVWGTNHNGYSTEWHISDAAGCYGQDLLFPALGNSTRQQTIALNWVLGLTRSTLLGTTSMDRLVDPAFALPAQISSLTLVDRGFVPTIAGRRLVHALDARLPGGCANKVAVTTGVTGSCTQWPEHDEDALVTLLRWGPPATAGSSAPAVRLRAGPTGNLDLSASTTLDVQFGPDCFRGTFNGALSCTDLSLQYPSGTPPTFNQPVSVFLEDTSGRRSKAVRMDQLASSRGPIGTALSQTDIKLHALLRTARIPMSAFGSGFSRGNIRYVWFDFRPTARGGFIIGEVSGQSIGVPAIEAGADDAAVIAASGEATMGDDGPSGNTGTAAIVDPGVLPPAGEAVVTSGDGLLAGGFVVAGDPLPVPPALIGRDASADRNRIVSITRVMGVDPADGRSGVEMVRIEVQSSRPFPATGRGLTLTIGAFSVTQPDPIVGGAMDRAVFEVPAAALKAKARAGDPVSVTAWSAVPAWRFGAVDAAALR